MAKRIETWFGNLFTPSPKIPPEYKQLAPRELVIVASGLFDAALVELLSLRFRDDRKEIDAFLGVEGDGRAPAGTFGARIQLAYLLGLIDAPMVKGLRGLKTLRNLMAHQVRVDLLSSEAQACLDILRGVFLSGIPPDSDSEERAFVEGMCEESRTDSELPRSKLRGIKGQNSKSPTRQAAGNEPPSIQGAKTLLLIWLQLCQIEFGHRHPRITRVDALFEE